MLERQNSSKQVQLIASVGAIIVAVIGAAVMIVK
jgi:hypothetical protein